ncbi:unnamed protein product [Penicillium salamii]|uniref:Zn(2)-C6 fungal-type domain-containing protein n=1 Tax=Penicillium salamii TaxID=1612424 RepID=A0A9W4NW58_9EURO|nr:unnamed protein product [Penicillium salamii]CAG8247271.1 unnamed protein product [Penicillium salamii]CAG8289860.1 unnamed protein product [Penicillium salamii]CAG8319819.1 unnamed protein product [Penicillium salamii]CAG8400965.1 unnamed protein product [Penicillium salamii]
MLRRTRRAPTACSWCQHRKVRCDASILGSPCTRCRQDGRKECILRCKNPRRSTILTSCPVQTDGSYNSSSGEDTADFTLASKAVSKHPASDHAAYTECDFVDTIQLSSLPGEDTSFLASEGCFDLPNSAAMDEFLQQYFTRVHPLVPVIDEVEFWTLYRKKAPTDYTISLFVLQSMLFASSSFVSKMTLKQCGFADRRDARRKLYNRAKLLFELGTEKKFHAKSQGAVMLTHYTSADDPRCGSLWVSIAIENAMLIGTQLSSPLEDISIPLKKRLWWSILLRDRSLCIGLRRQPQVTSVVSHGWCGWLTVEDFAEEMHHSEVYSYEAKMQLIVALQQQCELAVLVTDLAFLVFTHPRHSRLHLSMADFEKLISSITSIKESLDNWQSPQLVPDTPKNERPEAIATLNYLTHMYYHAARVDLAQFEAFMLEDNKFYAANTYQQSIINVSEDLRDAIEGLSKVMEHFSMHGQAVSFPLSVLGYVSMPLVLAAIDLKLSPSHSAMKAREKRLKSLSLIIKHSETLYDVTDFVAVGTNHILELAYAITQNLFFDRYSPDTPIDGALTEREVSRCPSRDVRSSSTTSLKLQRPGSWREAFVRCPRAYLLVSTSVDYSLAVGRLPSARDLPDIVRDLPALGMIPRFPWTSDIPPSLYDGSVQFPGHDDSGNWVFTPSRPYPESSEIFKRITQTHPHSPAIPPISSTAATFPIDDQSEYSEGKTNQASRPLKNVNLDYMDFSNFEFHAKAENIIDLSDSSSPLSLEDETEAWEQQTIFKRHGEPVACSPGLIESHLFNSFYHEAFEQRWLDG